MIDHFREASDAARADGHLWRCDIRRYTTVGWESSTSWFATEVDALRHVAQVRAETWPKACDAVVWECPDPATQAANA